MSECAVDELFTLLQSQEHSLFPVIDSTWIESQAGIV